MGSTWKAFLASEALAIRASKSSAPLSPQKPPSVASSALRRSQEREEQRQKMAQEAPTPVVQGGLWKRCVEVTYMGGYKPSTEAQLALDVEQGRRALRQREAQEEVGRPALLLHGRRRGLSSWRRRLVRQVHG